MANDTDGTAKSPAARGTFTPEYAKGYQEGYLDGYNKGLQAAMSLLEELSGQNPPLPTDIPSLRENDDIRYLDFTARTFGVLQRGGILTISDLQKRSLAGIRELRGSGPKVIQEIIERCAAYGISIREY